MERTHPVSAAVERAIEPSYYIHGRAGHSQGPRISDPRDADWQPAVSAHLAWWNEILQSRRAVRCGIMSICPGFGTPPYMAVLPHTAADCRSLGP